MPIDLESCSARRTRTGSLSAVGFKESEEEKDRLSGVHETVGGTAMARWISSPASDEGGSGGKRDSSLKQTILTFASVSDFKMNRFSAIG